MNLTANKHISIFEPVKVLRWLLAFAFAAPVVPLLYMRENRTLVLAIILFSISIVFVRYGRSFLAPFKTINPWIWALLGYTILSILWAGQPFISTKGVIQEVVVPLAFLATLTTGYSSSWLYTNLRFLTTILLIISIVVCLVWPEIGAIDYVGEGSSWIGVMSHKNELGRIALFCTICWAFTIHESNKSLNLWRIAIILIATITIYLTNNATSMLVLLFIFAFFFITRASKVVWTPIWYFVLALLIAGVGYNVAITYGYLSPFEALELLTQSAGKDPSLTGRSDLWVHVWSEIMNRPLLGTGYGVAWNDEDNHSGITFIGASGWVAGQSHNSFLGIMLKTGFIGFALWVMIIYSHIRNLFVIYQAEPKLAYFHFAILFMILACGIFSTLIYRGLPGPWNMVFWASIIEACYLSSIYRTQSYRIAQLQPETLR